MRLKKVLFFCLLICSAECMLGQEVAGSQKLEGLVDAKTGAFRYSIPLLSVPGPNGESFPVGLDYQSGVGMNQESSWVGLGWSLNVGQVSRAVHGVPDDSKGDLVTTKSRILPPHPLSPPMLEEQRSFVVGQVHFKDFDDVPYPDDATERHVGMDVNFSDVLSKYSKVPFMSPNSDRFSFSSPFFNGGAQLYSFTMGTLQYPHQEILEETNPVREPFYHRPQMIRDGDAVGDRIISYQYKPPRAVNDQGTSYSVPPSATFQSYGDYQWEHGEMRVSNYIQYFTNQELYSDYLSRQESPTGEEIPGVLCDPFDDGFQHRGDASVFPQDGIGYIRVYTADGLVLHYGLPAHTYDRYTMSLTLKSLEDVGHSGRPDNVIGRDFSNELERFASSWKLTAVTGPGYDQHVARNISSYDTGYWIKLTYGLWDDSFVTKSPYYGFNYSMNLKSVTEYKSKDRTNDLASVSQMKSELYYLNTIETSTHTALFIKKARKDSHGYVLEGVDPVPKLALDRVVLLKNDDIDPAWFGSVSSTIEDFGEGGFVMPSSGSIDYSLGRYEANRGQIDEVSLKSVVLEHDYSLAQRLYNNISNQFLTTGYSVPAFLWGSLTTEVHTINRNSTSFYSTSAPPEQTGRLTLKGVQILGYRAYDAMPGYEFDYELDPLIPDGVNCVEEDILTQNTYLSEVMQLHSDVSYPVYDHLQRDNWGNYKRFMTSLLDQYPVACDRYVQNLWSLKTIRPPSGPAYRVDYEARDFEKMSHPYSVPRRIRRTFQASFVANFFSELNTCFNSSTNYRKILFEIRPKSSDYLREYYFGILNYNQSLAAKAGNYSGQDFLPMSSAIGCTRKGGENVVISAYPSLVQMKMNSGDFIMDFADPRIECWVEDGYYGYVGTQPRVESESESIILSTFSKAIGGGPRVSSIVEVGSNGADLAKMSVEYSDGLAVNEPDRFEKHAASTSYSQLIQYNGTRMPRNSGELAKAGIPSAVIYGKTKFNFHDADADGNALVGSKEKWFQVNVPPFIATVRTDAEYLFGEVDWRVSSNGCVFCPPGYEAYDDIVVQADAVPYGPFDFNRYKGFHTFEVAQSNILGKILQEVEYDRYNNIIGKSEYTYEKKADISLRYASSTSSTDNFNEFSLSSVSNHMRKYLTYKLRAVKSWSSNGESVETIFDSWDDTVNKPLRKTQRSSGLWNFESTRYAFMEEGLDHFGSVQFDNWDRLHMLSLPSVTSVRLNWTVPSGQELEYVEQVTVRQYDSQLSEFVSVPSETSPRVRSQRVLTPHGDWVLTNETLLAEPRYKTSLLSIDDSEVMSARKMSADGLHTLVSGQNVGYHEFGHTSFEEQIEQDDNLTYTTSEIAVYGDIGYDPSPHTGEAVLDIPIGSVGASFTIEQETISCSLGEVNIGLRPGRTYSASVWYKGDGIQLEGYLTGSQQMISAGEADVVMTCGQWSKVEVQVTVPSDYPISEALVFSVRNIDTGSSSDLRVDDFRVQPVDAQVSSMVRDELTGQVVSSCGQDNMYTRYEYDGYGQLLKTFVERPLGAGEVMISEKIMNYEEN